MERRNTVLRGILYGALFGLVVIHATAALVQGGGGAWRLLADAYTSDLGFLVYHAALGAVLGGGIAWLSQRELEKRIRLEQEQKHLENEVLQAQKLETVGRLTSGVAHDFNNILSAVGMQLHLAANYPKNRDRNIAKAAAAVRRAARLPQQLLTFSRQGDAHEEVIDPNQTLHAVVELMERTVGENVDLALVAGDVKGILIDPVQFEQVAMNLVVNARDATKQGAITVSSRRTTDPEGLPDGPYVEVSVTDTGSGIPAEIQETIFDPFFTTKDEGKGTGLGLSTCKRIAEEARGTIRLESRPGHTVFRVLLPEVELTRSEADDQELPGGTETLLVADDDPNIQHGLVEILEAMGYTVHACRDGIDALRALRSHKPELLIADVALSGISGVDLADHARRLDPAPKVLLISSGGEEGSIAPGARVLHKPLRPEQVLLAIRRVLDS